MAKAENLWGPTRKVALQMQKDEEQVSVPHLQYSKGRRKNKNERMMSSDMAARVGVTEEWMEWR